MWLEGKSYLFVLCTVLKMKKSVAVCIPCPARVVIVT